MKKIARIIAAALAIGFGGNEAYEFSIENYGDTEIVLEDGTVFETKEITKHKTKVFPKREDIDIYGVVLHYAAWDTQDVNEIAKWHVNGNDWPGIGYWAAIKKDGTFAVLNGLETMSYHSKGSNKNYIGICFLTAGKLTDNQIKTAKAIMEGICLEYDIKKIVGHRDVRATTCPGDEAYKQLEENGIFFNNK